MNATHSYQLTLRWTGNCGSGTDSYRSYGRDHELTAAGKLPILGSADPAFRGDLDRWNPEELLVASLSQCHLLWFLHLAATAGVVVLDYTDEPIGTMLENPDGSGQFSQVLLQPRVTVAAPAMCEPAQALHDRVDELCFIARSVNFPVRHQPSVRAVSD
ncbi:MAG: OsmC family protein [Jatrophihabitantaceae bacterium]